MLIEDMNLRMPPARNSCIMEGGNNIFWLEHLIQAGQSCRSSYSRAAGKPTLSRTLGRMAEGIAILASCCCWETSCTNPGTQMGPRCLLHLHSGVETKATAASTRLARPETTFAKCRDLHGSAVAQRIPSAGLSAQDC